MSDDNQPSDGKMNSNTCLIERSQVREILMTAITLDNDTTNSLLRDIDSLPIVTLGDAEMAVERLQALVGRLKLEAQGHAQEARTANATIAEAYQAATGATGEPGNWNGAKPIRNKITQLEARLEQIAAVCRDNAGPNCNHKMALAFVWDVATSAKAQI